MLPFDGLAAEAEADRPLVLSGLLEEVIGAPSRTPIHSASGEILAWARRYSSHGRTGISLSPSLRAAWSRRGAVDAAPVPNHLFAPLKYLEDLLPYRLDDRALAAVRAAKVTDAVLNKLDPIKKKEFTEEPFQKELAKLLTKEEREIYQDELLAAAQDFEHAKKLKVIVSGLQRVREGTEVDFGQVEKMLDQRPGQKKK